MKKHFLVTPLRIIIVRNSLNNARFFSRSPVLRGASNKNEPSFNEMLRGRSEKQQEDSDKQFDAYLDTFNNKSKQEAVNYWKSELSAHDYDWKVLDALRRDVGASHTSNDPFTRDQGRDLLSRAQALEGAAITCKHKLVPKDIGLENPSWVKIREDKEK